MTIVAIVGIDGSGKTTQARRLVENLRKRGHDAVYVEPAFLLLKSLEKHGQVNCLSRVSPRKARTSIVAGKPEDHLQPARGFFIAVLGYAYAFLTYLLMAYQSNRKGVLVCDRYFFQFFFDLFGNAADNFIDIFPKPDVTVFLDGRLDCSYARMRSESDASTSRVYYSRVRALLRRACRRYDFTYVNTELDIRSVEKEVLLEVIKELEEGPHE